MKIPITLLRELLQKGHKISLISQGSSMEPSIRGGEKLILGRACEFSLGDLVVYERGGRLITHRVIWKEKRKGRGFLITKGDSLLSSDPPIEEKQVIGKVVALEKPNGLIILDGSLWRGVNLLLCLSSLLSQGMFSGAYRIKRWLFGERKNRLTSFCRSILFFMSSSLPNLLFKISCQLQGHSFFIRHPESGD